MSRAKSKTEASGKSKVPLKKALGLYRYLLNYKKIFYPSLLALFLTAALSLAFPYFLSNLVGNPQDALNQNQDHAEIARHADENILILLIVLAVQAAVSFFRVQGFIRSGESALNDIRQDVFSRVLRLPMNYHMNQRAGELSGRIATDLGVMRDTLLTTIPQLVRHTVILIGGLIFIFITSTKLALIMLASIPVVVIAVALIGRKIRNFSKAAQDALSDSQVVVEEAAQGIYAVKSFSNESLEEDKYASSLKTFLTVTCKGAMARAAFISFITLVMMGTIAIVVWLGANMLNDHEITSTEFIRFILFSIFVGASLGSLPEVFSQLRKTAGATERLEELLEEPVESQAVSEDRIEAGSVELKNLTFAYTSRLDRPVLNGVDVSIEAGQRVAIVGASGAGKSTIFSLLLGFYDAQEGELCFDGKSMQDWGLTTVRQAMAVVPQDVSLFGSSIAENIGYGRPGSSIEEIRQAAQKANALEFIDDCENGFETLVGPRGMKLSGGQRQRVAIARAILADPKILLLDEATSALDSESERLVQTALDELMKGRTSLIIAHRLATVRNVDRILVLDGGKIVESGTHEELMEKKGTYELLARTQLL